MVRTTAAIALWLAPFLAGQQAVPDADAIAAAQPDFRRMVAQAVGLGGGPEAICERLSRIAARTEGSLAYLLHRQSQALAVEVGDPVLSDRIAQSISRAFDLDVFQERTAALVDLEGRVATMTLVGACVQRAEEWLENKTPEAAFGVLRVAAGIAGRARDSHLMSWVVDRESGFRTARLEFDRLIEKYGAFADAYGTGDWVRYSAFHRGRWSVPSGVDLPDDLAALVLPDDTTAAGCLEGAERLRRAAGREGLAPSIRRHLLARSLFWYRRAWPLFVELERARVEKLMSEVEAKLSELPGLANLRFAEGAAFQQLVFRGGRWGVQGGSLRGKNLGDEVRATSRVAWERIDAVTIRGGILSEPAQNFRIAIGDLNILFNWEVRPESHFYAGPRNKVVFQHLLDRGKEHAIEIRQIGPHAVVWLDGKKVYQGHCQLKGTVCVYPAVQSEVFVAELHVLGTPDLSFEVQGPIGTVR